MTDQLALKDWQRLAALRQGIIAKLERKIRRLENELEDLRNPNQENPA
ncbi:hypothetical protein GCM10009596_23520 [Arthrobacter rhombi]